MTNLSEHANAESSMRLSEAQQVEVRNRLAKPGPFVPDEEMKAFFRKLKG